MADLAARIGKPPTPADLGMPEQIAHTLMAALKGIKSSSASVDDYRAAQVLFAAVFGRALAV